MAAKTLPTSRTGAGVVRTHAAWRLRGRRRLSQPLRATFLAPRGTQTGARGRPTRIEDGSCRHLRGAGLEGSWGGVVPNCLLVSYRPLARGHNLRRRRRETVFRGLEAFTLRGNVRQRLAARSARCEGRPSRWWPSRAGACTSTRCARGRGDDADPSAKGMMKQSNLNNKHDMTQ